MPDIRILYEWDLYGGFQGVDMFRPQHRDPIVIGVPSLLSHSKLPRDTCGESYGNLHTGAVISEYFRRISEAAEKDALHRTSVFCTLEINASDHALSCVGADTDCTANLKDLHSSALLPGWPQRGFPASRPPHISTLAASREA